MKEFTQDDLKAAQKKLTDHSGSIKHLDRAEMGEQIINRALYLAIEDIKSQTVKDLTVTLDFDFKKLEKDAPITECSGACFDGFPGTSGVTQAPNTGDDCICI